MNQEILDQPLHEVEKEKEPYTGKQIHLVNDRSIYFKGLFGLLFCILPGAIVGLVLVKMSLDQAKEAMIEYQSNPGKYKDASIETVKSGRKMAYIGLAVFILEIVIFLAYTSI